MKEKIKELESLLAEWEAAEDEAVKKDLRLDCYSWRDKIYGIKAAIRILEEPSNQAVSDVCICAESNPFVSDEYAGRCRKCGLLILMPR